MCVVAHPDDECFAFGGALALAAERGIETYVICLTDGQAATNRGDATTAAALGAMRREGVLRSGGGLGVAQDELVDYHDGGLEVFEVPVSGGGAGGRRQGFNADVGMDCC